MKAIIFCLYIAIVTGRYKPSCTGDLCPLTDRSMVTCSLTCNNCYCDTKNSTLLACFISDKIIDDICVDRTDNHFLHYGRCIEAKQTYCGGYVIEEYKWCPYIMRSICNFFRSICRFLGGNVKYLSMRYYLYKDIYGKSYKSDELLRGVVDCNKNPCYTTPSPVPLYSPPPPAYTEEL